MKIDKYTQLLNDSYKAVRDIYECPPESRLEYLSDHIFDFTTYDSEMSELFAKKSVEVSEAITNQSTIDYIRQSDENYRWYLLMCNMPFFYKKLDWGTSIRGAWWDHGVTFTIDTCGFFQDREQMIDPVQFTRDEWIEFIQAIVEFSKLDVRRDQND